MKSSIFGWTSQNLPIPSYKFGRLGDEVLILGGVHGDEVEGVAAALGLIGEWSKAYPFHLRITVVPAFNLDGVLQRSRLNARGVDLNRNLPTNDWTAQFENPRYFPGPQARSEPESLALIEWLDKHKPVLTLSLHSWKPCLNTNGDCLLEAEAIAKITGYEVVSSIGYPTPGCLGTYAGLERDLPTLTYELERGLKTEQILSVHVPAIIEGLKVCERRRRHSLA